MKRNYWKLLGIVPIVIYMMVIQKINLEFATKIVVLGAIICTSVIVVVCCRDDKTKDQRKSQYLTLLAGLTISAAIFVYQFLKIGYK